MPQQELSISSGAAPGISFSTSMIGATAPKAFWWQWPCSRIGAAAGLKVTEKRPALASRARNSSTKSAYLATRSEEHTSALQQLIRISYDVFSLKKKLIH